MQSVLLMGTLLIALAAGAAHAQSPAPPAEERNSPATQISPRSGSSGNPAASIAPNKVTSKEVDAAFERADANRDGRLDRREAEQFPAVAQRFDQIDSNRDGFVSREELRVMTGS